jgi:hypothetical protein
MNEELYAGHAEELRKRGETIAGIERAQAAVLPGALRQAFGSNGATKCEGFILLPVSLGMTTALERADSPMLEVLRIYRKVMADPGPEERSQAEMFREINRLVGEIESEPEQVAETIFTFITPWRKVLELLESGRKVFRGAAMDALGEIHPEVVARLERGCVQHYVRSFATVVGYGVPPPEGGGAVFRAPSPSEVTGSAGG